MSNNLMIASKSKYDRMASKSPRPYNRGYQDLELYVCMLSETIINGWLLLQAKFAFVQPVKATDKGLGRC